jgi:hypothetical protein
MVTKPCETGETVPGVFCDAPHPARKTAAIRNGMGFMGEALFGRRLLCGSRYPNGQQGARNFAIGPAQAHIGIKAQ